MAKILCLNNYDVSAFAVDNRPSPDHFLFGINDLHRRGHQILLGGERLRPWLRQFQNVVSRMKLNSLVGDLVRERNALASLDEADLIYCPCDSVVQGFATLRSVGLLRKPIVCLAHHPPHLGRSNFLRKRLSRFVLRGIDAFPSLSAKVSAAINELAPGRNLSRALPWGPDLSFYPPYSRPGLGIVSAGRTGRDFVTFGASASRTTSPTTIICPKSYVNVEFDRFAANVEVLAHDDPLHYSYRDLIEFYSRSRAIAIPMDNVAGLCGLTSLLDAMAMGRAVVMTKNPLIDIDIEALDIGFWIEPGDIEGWRRAIQFLEDRPAEAEEMGARARRLAEERWNSRTFGAHIVSIVESSLSAASRTRQLASRKV